MTPDVPSARSRSQADDAPAPVTVLGPHPVLSVIIEPQAGAGDEIHVQAAGQGVWVARMAATLGAHPVLCGFVGGDNGAVLRPLLEALPGECRLVAGASGSGAYVMDHRGGSFEFVAKAFSTPATHRETDDLVAATIASALQTRLLVLCNPLPGDSIVPECYARLTTDLRAQGVTVLADLSSPRLEAALEGGLDLVRINDWELAEYAGAPVDDPADLAVAAGRLQSAGAAMVVISRGERPAVVFRGDAVWELAPPAFERGFREGCGDSMMGAYAAVVARGGDWQEALRLGAAAGAANFLRRGLGNADPDVIAELAASVTLRELAPPRAA